MTDPTDVELRALCEEAQGREDEGYLSKFGKYVRTALPRLLDERDGLQAYVTRHESAMKLIGEAAALLEKDKGLIASLATVRAERDALRDDMRTVAEALAEISRQRTSVERELAGDDEGDLEHAYDVVIRKARAALAIAERHANKEGGAK